MQPFYNVFIFLIPLITFTRSLKVSTFQSISAHHVFISSKIQLEYFRSEQLKTKWLHILSTSKEVMFSVCLLVELSAGLWENCWPDYHETWWRGVARAKEEPTTFWIGSESRDRYTHYFSFSLSLRDKAFGLGGIMPYILKSSRG